MPEPVVLRGARAADLPAILELTCQAFGEQVRPRMAAMLYGDSTLRLEDLRLAEVGGTIASVVRIADRPIYYGGAVLRMGGVGAVSTLPAFQGRGLSTLVLGDAISAMRVGGFHLSMLFTGIQPFYARLGWAPFPEYSFRCQLGESPPELPDDACAVRPFDITRDLPAVERIYDEANRDRIGPAVRGHRSWVDEHARVLGVLPTLVARRDGDVIAYATFGAAGETLRLREAGCAAGTVAAYRALAAAIVRAAGDAGVTAIEGRLPRGHGLRATLQEVVQTPIEGRMTPTMMLRVVDLQRLMRAALPTLDRRVREHGGVAADIAFGLRVDDGYVRLAIADGGVVVDAGPTDHVLDVPAGLFWRLFLGDRSPALMQDELAPRGSVLSDAERALLAVLFPPQDPVYWIPDHF